MDSRSVLLLFLLITSSTAADLLLWAEEVDTDNPSQPEAKIQTLPADPTTYAPGLIATGEIQTAFKYNVVPGKFVALDTDHQDQVIFFSASLRTAVYKGTVNAESNSANRVFGGSSNRVEGIAVDWLAKTLYIIDQTYNWIFLINHREPNRYVILVRDGLDKPRGIAVHPAKGLLFWSDCGDIPKIERANLDGTNRTSLITTGIKSPNGLSVDYVENRLYWTNVDDSFSKVESCDLDGSNRRVLFSQSSLTAQFFKLKVHKDYVYITDWNRKLWCVFKTSGAVYFSLNLKSRPHGVTVYGDGDQEIQPSPCLTNPCSQICTSGENNYTCVCRDSYFLLPDGKTCQKGDFIGTPLFLFSNQTSIGKLPSNFPNTAYPNDFTVDGFLNNQRFVVALQVDVARRLLFFSDVVTRSVFSLELKNGGKRKVVAGQLGSVQGIAVDYLSQTLYWTDSTKQHIMASSYDGRYRLVLIDTAIVQPRSIAVDPIQRWMFWLELGSQPQIERARLNGSDRKMIVNTRLGAASGIHFEKFWFIAFLGYTLLIDRPVLFSRLIMTESQGK
ncbi:low-density lipoprotein receptor-related protein 4-like [Anneissia japonica]|uniref:low-density lipoprotein receptor-related protein 4-like n=1 Tax=Anneissia japonica TaxID=1529436 RepID=UPI0014254B58|nr:low-density lipoprotein receptor-related protein 4-like [Anneissia japonica]